ncbi:MAG: FecR domain-containing protein, partial [Fervidobacterium sp.]
IKIEGKGEINYLAPRKTGTAMITLTAETSDKKVFVKELKVEITEKDESEFSDKLKATIDSFKGSVAYKKEGKQVWESIKKDTILQEGDEILTLEKAYVIVKFPDGSMTKITENTQVLFEKLRRAKDGRILVSIVIKKGGTYNVVQKMVAGSSFEVKAGSVTAGVRGTKFETSLVDEKPVLKVWEGEVLAFYEDSFVFPVFEGQKLAFELFTTVIEDITELFQGTQLEPLLETLPSFEEIEMPEIEMPEIEIPEKPQEPSEEKKVQEPTKPTYESPSQAKAYIPPLGVETAIKDNQKYIVYSISPEFTIGPVSLGLGLTAYATEVGGTLYYGLPSTEPSTNIINMITINSVAIDLGNFYVRYGNMPMMSLGMGFSVRDYFKPFAKSFDVKGRFGSFGMTLHLPYELSKLWPFQFSQSDSVFAGELEFKNLIFGMDTGIAILYDTQVSTSNVLNNSTPVNLSLSSYFRYPLFNNFYFGFELSSQHLTDSSIFGLGAFGGLSGRISLFDIIAGAYLKWNGFIPFYFGRTYATKKAQNKLEALNPDGEFGFGYLAGFNFDTQYAAGRFYLLGDFSGDLDALGELRI